MKWLLSGKDIQEVEKRKQKKRINSLMKDAAKLIRELSNGETELAEKLMAEVQKNR